jgi:hypothetical protein
MKIIIFVVTAQLEPKNTNNGNGSKQTSSKSYKIHDFCCGPTYTGENKSYEIHNICSCTKQTLQTEQQKCFKSNQQQKLQNS